MKKLKFDLPEYRKVEINGHVFDILKADADVLVKAQELRNRYSELTQKGLSESDFDEIVAAVKGVIDYIDEMLGEGATKKIVGGRPLGIVPAIHLMTMVCKAVVEEYNEDVTNKYGD